MFRKIISNLAFQPSLLEEVSLYINKLKKSNNTRKYGVISLIVLLILSLYLSISTPFYSNRAHQSDIVYGASSKTDIVNAYRRDKDQLGRNDIRSIYNHYGIGEMQIINARQETISDNNTNLIINTRNNASDKAYFVSIKTALNGGLYEMPLAEWQTQKLPSQHQTLTGLSSYGYRFWIVLDSGNIIYEKGAKKPNLEIYLNTEPIDLATNSHQLLQQILFRNNGAAISENTVIEYNLPSGIVYSRYESDINLALDIKNDKLSWSIDNVSSKLAPSDRWHNIKLFLEIKPSLKSEICTNSYITAKGLNKLSSNPKGNDCFNLNRTNCNNSGESLINDNCDFVVNNSTADNSDALRLSTSVLVSNQTQNINDANNTIAHPEDILVYTLKITNNSKNDIVDFEYKGEYAEDVSDILEYADIFDFNGAELDALTSTLSWPKEVISPGQTIVKSFSVKLKDPQPKNMVSRTNPLSYDNIIRNYYGNVVNIKLNEPWIKSIEKYSLNVSKGKDTFAIGLLLMIILLFGYSYCRNSLIEKELRIIKKENLSGVFDGK